MLEFYYDCVDKYLSHEDFEYSKMDTDSAYMEISGDSFESLIKPDLREEFEKDNHNWFVTPLAPQGNVLLDFSRLNSRETLLLFPVANRIVQNFLLLKIHLVK